MLNKLINYIRPQHYESNIEFMKIRKEKQFDLIDEKTEQNPEVLTASLRQLKNINNCIYTFAKRAKHFQYLNAVADINIESAINNTNTIPFSVKNQLKVKDMIPTCGYAANAQQKNIAKSSCLVVQLLEKHGMTAYLQTNIPQGLWGIESNNRIFGISSNPYDQRFVSGGSSGGQAAIVRMCCSAFGVGSDLAGSVRIPAGFCGVYSFKPTGSRRLSRKGRLSITGSQIQIIKQIDPSFGYFTRQVDDIEYLLNLTMGQGDKKDWIVQGKWQQQKYKQNITKKMKIGYMTDLQQIETAPAIREAILQTVKKLQQQGHEVVEFKFDQLSQFRDIINKINATPGIYKTVLDKLGGQPIVQHNKQMAILQTLGNWALTLRSKLCKDEQEKKIFQNLRSLSIMQFYGVIAQNEILKEKFIQTWNLSQIDILITPVTPFTALLKGASKYLVNCLTFCCFQNALEMPAGVVPVGLVKANQTKYNDNRFFGRLAKDSIEKSQGLPVCIQVSARPYQDQLCLAAMKNIQNIVGQIPLPKYFLINKSPKQ